MMQSKHKAVFLDRDNTLIEDPGYINHPDQVKLMMGAAGALVQLKKMGYLLVVVSNQSGIARGIFTEETLGQIHHRLEKLLADEGVYLDGIYFCPFHPDGVIEKYRKESDCRKPAPGMLLQAAQEMNIDLSRSWMIGDSYRDIEAGRRAGCKTILIASPVKPAVKGPGDPEADRKAVNIREAVNIIRMQDLRQNWNRTRNEPAGPDGSKPADAPAATPEMDTPAPAAQEPNIIIPQPIIADKPAAPVQQSAVPQAVKDNGNSAMPLAGIQPEIQSPKKENKPSAPLPPPQTEDASTEKLLAEILTQLKAQHKSGQYEDFSLMKVIAGAMQVIAVFCLIVSLWFLFDQTRSPESVHTLLGYAAVVQLMAITFYFMWER